MYFSVFEEPSEYWISNKTRHDCFCWSIFWQMVKPEGTTVSLQKRDDNHEPNALSHFQLVHTKMPFPKNQTKIDYPQPFFSFW